MAERFRSSGVGAKYYWAWGGWLLFILPLPLFPTLFVALFKGALWHAITTIGALGLFAVGALATRRGLAFEKEYESRKVARAPRLPLKLLGSLFTGAGVLLCALFLVGQGLFFSLFSGLLSMVGFFLTYGFDPTRDKGVASTGFGYTTDDVLDAIREAETKIGAIRSAARGIQNRELRERLGRIGDSAEKIVGVIEENPDDLRRARKFLNVYLDGARKVAEGYAQTHRRTQSAELESNFRNVLVTIEAVFSEQYGRLLENDVLDLDVQIEVLATRLKHEGVA